MVCARRRRARHTRPAARLHALLACGQNGSYFYSLSAFSGMYKVVLLKSLALGPAGEYYHESVSGLCAGLQLNGALLALRSRSPPPVPDRLQSSTACDRVHSKESRERQPNDSIWILRSVTRSSCATGSSTDARSHTEIADTVH